MSVDLHQSCKARITELIAKALPKIEVDNGMFIRRMTGFVNLEAADQALPQTGELQARLQTYIDERPLTEFVIDTLTDELRDASYNDSSGQSLTTLPGYENPHTVAERLVDEFTALPNEYKLTFRLPNELWPILNKDVWEYELGPHIRLVRSGPELEEAYPLKTDNDDRADRIKGNSLLASLGDLKPLEWAENAVFLQLDATGFIGGYGGSIPEAEARRAIRSFCGLGIALQLFERRSLYRRFQPSDYFVVHRKRTDNTWELRERIDVGDDLSRALERLNLNNANGWVNSPERQVVWSDRILEEMKTTYAAGKKSAPILLASQWYFDSATGSDELLTYIQAMVVLEILLGDKTTSDQVGLNELLRNRCAYLIGSSQEDRAELHKAFGEIYAVRSQIVHRGKHSLTMNERILFGRLRWMCRRVIQKEVDLLKANRSKTN
jgi:hypothetical protein